MAEKILDAMFLFLVLLASKEDVKKREIPDSIPVAMAAVVAAAAWAIGRITLSDRLTGIFCLSLPLIFLAYIRPGSFGGGDIKLAAAGGGFLGIRRALVAGGAAIVIGAVVLGVLLFAKKVKWKDEVPFVPFLGLGMAVGLFWGSKIAAWYTGG